MNAPNRQSTETFLSLTEIEQRANTLLMMWHARDENRTDTPFETDAMKLIVELQRKLQHMLGKDR